MQENLSSTPRSACGCGCGEKPDAGDSRRGFVAGVVAALVGVAALAGPMAVGLVAFLDPLRRKKQSGTFRRVATLDALPTDGTPRKFPIIADRTDAWTLYKNVPIGSVFLRRTGEKDVKALAVICPHAGCFVSYDATAKDFLCPCHVARFDLEGRRTDAKSKSPRDMDALAVEIRGKDEVWVKFETFRTGVAEKVVQA